MMVALICLCFILAGTLVGVWLRSRLPAQHLSKESESVVKLGVGLIATLSALVLGLLISSAKSTYDAKASEVNQITANIIMIDQLLSEYGPEVRPAREKLRSSVQGLVQKMWDQGNEKSANSGAFTPTAAGVGDMAPCQQSPDPNRDATELEWPDYRGSKKSISIAFVTVRPEWGFDSCAISRHTGLLAGDHICEL